MVAVLISIRPKWVHKILNGKKTIEIRKTAPKITTPFKCYIYMTSGGWEWRDPFSTAVIPPRGVAGMYNGAQMVVAEFTCDRIIPIKVFKNGTIQDWNRYCLEESCVPYDEMVMYIGCNRSAFGWHISDLKVYEEPKMLSKFRNPCKEYDKDNPRCGSCDFYHAMGEYPAECACDGLRPVLRPPQSWCYVQEK